MKKLNLLWLILGSVVFLVFNAVFFMTGMNIDAGFSIWMTYVFVMIAFGVFLAAIILTDKYTVTHRIFKLLPAEFGALYFGVQLILGFIYILIEPEKYITALLLQIFLLAAFVIVLLVNLIISEKSQSKLDATKTIEVEEAKEK